MKEFNTDYTETVVCPYCGREQYDYFSNSKEGVRNDIECSYCAKRFQYEVIYTIEYSSYKKDGI